MEWAKLKLKAFPVAGARFSAACDVLVDTDGVAPFGGVIAGNAYKSERCVGGCGWSGIDSLSGGSSGPLYTGNGRGATVSVIATSFSFTIASPDGPASNTSS
jgi:hypothetical protein